MAEAVEAGFRTLSDLEPAAARKVPPPVWAYIQGGSGVERTLEHNLEAYRCWALRPKVLAGVSALELGTTLLSETVRAPFFVAPSAYQGLVHPGGETETARAAARAGILAVYSTLSSRSLEDIANASGTGPRWFQLYLQPDFSVSRKLVERAEKAGFTAVVLTVDMPVIGVRDRQSEGGVAFDWSVPTGNGPDVVPPARSPVPEGRRFVLRPDAAATWEIVDRLRAVTDLPIVVKGILNAEDARHAVEHGARAIVVSNHGGRQLDGAPASLEALPEVVAAVGAEVEVYLDGGIRRGSDVLIALALGARGVGIGRPVLWALAAGGEAGVSHYLELMTHDLAVSMALVGRSRIAEVDRTLVAARSP